LKREHKLDAAKRNVMYQMMLVALEFKGGASMHMLAQRYGISLKDVEHAVRQVMINSERKVGT